MITQLDILAAVLKYGESVKYVSPLLDRLVSDEFMVSLKARVELRQILSRHSVTMFVHLTEIYDDCDNCYSFEELFKFLNNYATTNK